MTGRPRVRRGPAVLAAVVLLDTTVPKVLIECGNMRNATDAALLVTPSFQQAAAAAMAQAITTFLTGRSG